VVGFRRNPLVAPVDIAGTYTMTIVADAACTDILWHCGCGRITRTVSAQPLDDRPAAAAFDLNVSDDSMIACIAASRLAWREHASGWECTAATIR
jgi:hypothetical protein